MDRRFITHQLMLYLMHAHDRALDDSLVEEASSVTGVKERTQLLHDGLRALIARENARAIIALGGSDPDAGIPERRRPKSR